MTVPRTFRFPVELDDLDYMGIVGNGNWLVILQRARTHLLAAIGYPMDRLIAEGLGGVVAELNVRYLRPARYGDTLAIEIGTRDASLTGGTLTYVVRNQSDKTCVEAWTRMVFVNDSGRPAPMPESIRTALFG